MKEFQHELEEAQVHYSRSDRHRSSITVNQAMDDDWEGMPTVETVKIKWPHYVAYLLLSFLVSSTTVVLPVLSDFANGLQVQHLYTGMAVAYGQLPYTNLFATGGFLYYVIIALLGSFQSGLLLVGVQWLALFVSGVYFEKSLIRLTNREDLGQGLIVVFYLLQLAFGFGGLYPIQWAMPFLLMGFYYISSYWQGHTKDEVFIGYGLVAGLSVLLDPKTLLFWLCALLLLVIFNILHKRWARGFYQFLALCFGLVFPIYVALYFMLNLQVLSPALKQTVFYPFMALAFENEDLLSTLGLQFAGLLLTGLLTGWLAFYSLIKPKPLQSFSYWLLFLTIPSYTVLALVSQSFWLYPLLYVLPFGLLLTGSWLVKHADGRRLRMAGLYVRRQWLLPLLAFLVLAAYPVGRGLLEKPLNHERDQVVAFLANQTSEDDMIYVWDKTSRIYLHAERQSSSQLSSPAFYTMDSSNMTLLEDELLQHRAKYFVLNKDLPLSDVLSNDIAKHYEKVTDKTFSHFVIYELK